MRKKINYLMVLISGLIPVLKADNIKLQNDHLKVLFPEKENYVLTSLAAEDAPAKTSILKKMELIFHYNTKEGFYFTGESNTKSRFGKKSKKYNFTISSLSKTSNSLEIVEKNQNFEIERICELANSSNTLSVNYQIKGLRDTFLGPHSLCPAMNFELRKPLIIFPTKKIVKGIVKWSAGSSSKEAVKCNGWMIIFDEAAEKGIVIKTSAGKICAFRHKRIGSNQKPVWVVALKPHFLAGHYSTGNSINNISLKLTHFTGKYKDLAANFISGQNKSSSATDKNTGSLLTNNNDICIWTLADDCQITKQGPVPTSKVENLFISSAGNESSTTPIILRNKKVEPVLLTVKTTDFKSIDGKNAISAKNITWRKAEWFKVESSSYPEAIIGCVPDALAKVPGIDIKNDENTLIWLKIAVPPKTPGGIYHGSIIFENKKRIVSELAVTLKVFNFSLPEKRNFPCWSPVWDTELKRVYGSARAKKIRGVYHDNIFRHRSGMWASCPVLRFKPGSTDIEFLSWENFEKDLDLFFNKLKMPYAVCRVFRIGGAHHLIGTQYGKKEDIFSKLWTARYKKMAGIMREYEKRKGIKGKIIYELYDEPYDKDYDKLAGCAKILRSVYPDIKLTFWSGRGIIPGLLKDIDVWTVSNMSFSSSLSAQLQKQGKQVWIYNPVQWTDLSMPMGSSRRLFWYLWTKKVNGLFFWNISAWKEWGGRYSRPNRDSTFVYPGKDGPINTLRWENFRDGLEDYEYLSLLSQAVNNTKSGKANKKDKIAAAEAGNFIKEINRTDFRAIDSMAELIRFREGLAIRIEKLKKYLPVEKKAAKFIMDKKAGVIGNIVLRLSPKDFPKLNCESKRGGRIIKISKNDGAVKLSSRLFSFDLSGSPEKRIVELEFEVRGTAEIMPVLFVRFAGLVKPDSCLKPVKISTGKCKKMSFRFQIASRGKSNIQLKVIFNITGSKSLEISNATLKVNTDRKSV